MSQRKIKVCVSGHDLKFWMPIQNELEKSEKYEFRIDEWSGHNEHDESATLAAIEWADVVVAEWALGNAVFCTRHKRPGQRLLVRLHLQERTTPYPAKMDFAKVDAMIFVGPHILQECVSQFGIPRNICELIGNYVDVDRYDHPKFGGAEFNLGIIGTAPMRKRLDLAVDTLELLSRKDDRYMLRVKGQSPANIEWLWARTAERAYYEALYERINSGPLCHKVVFDPQGHDVQHWLKMIGYLLSPSDFESFHMAVAEGGASGAIPVVWNWEGAAEIYPEFQTVSTPKEAAEQIEFFNRSATGHRLRQQIKDIVRNRYDKKTIVGKWDSLIEGNSNTLIPVIGKRKQGKGLLVVWAIDNWPTFHRREMLTALAGNLRDEMDFLIIEPGNHLQAVAKAQWAPLEELKRVGCGELVVTGENIYRTRLLTGGGTTELPITAPQGGKADQVEVLDALIAAHFPEADVVHWVYKPDQVQRLKGQPYIYEVYDDYTVNFGTGALIERMSQLEPGVLAGARHVFFTSETLSERKSGVSASHSVIGNGVNYEAFARYRLPRNRREGRPAVGYLGNLSDFFDWELMLEVCKAMPQVDFMLHGQIEHEKLGNRAMICDAMLALPNVFASGRVGREHGAAAVCRYDALIIPFVVNAAMHAVNPLKLWEYYATGLPVVSSEMDAVKEPPSRLRVAGNVEEWVSAISASVKESEQDAQRSDDRIEAALAKRWDVLTDMHAKRIREVLEEVRC